MEPEPFEAESRSSATSLVERSLGLITPNTEILAIMFCGVEKQKVLLVPWLLCSVLRSILLTLLQSLAGIVLCAAQDKVHYNCLKYSTMNGANLCLAVFMWTSVHSFYHYLDKKKSNHEFEMVIKTIHKAGMRKIRSDSIDSSESSGIFPLEGLDEDELPGTEATLVERAAMAWIAREILEDDGEYVTDSQFSHYLALKATMELRQIMKELSEKRKSEKRNSSMKDKIKDSLEFCKKTSKHYESTSEIWQPKLEAFDESTKLSKRDPIRKIPPLVVLVKPFVDDDESLEGDDMGPLQINVASSTSAVLENSVEVQTDPVSSEMNQLFEWFEQQHEKQKINNHSQHDPGDNSDN